MLSLGSGSPDSDATITPILQKRILKLKERLRDLPASTQLAVDTEIWTQVFLTLKPAESFSRSHKHLHSSCNAHGRPGALLGCAAWTLSLASAASPVSHEDFLDKQGASERCISS